MTPPMTGGQNLGTAHGSIVIDTSQLGRAVQQTQSFARQLESGLSNLRNVANLTFAGLAANQIAQSVVRWEQLGTQIRRTTVALESMVGGGAQAAAIVESIRAASGGAIDNMTAMQVALQGTALGLADTTAEFRRLTQAARVVTLISPQIHDVQSAITELALASANLSFRRLDQLGLSVTEVRNRMQELQRANTDLEDSQAFLAASIDVLLNKYGPLLTSTEAQATSFERLSVAAQDAAGRIAEATSAALNWAAAPVARVILGPTQQEQLAEFDTLFANLRRQQQDLANRGMQPRGMAEAVQLFRDAEKAIEASNQAIVAGVPGAERLRDLLIAAARQGVADWTNLGAAGVASIQQMIDAVGQLQLAWGQVEQRRRQVGAVVQEPDAGRVDARQRLHELQAERQQNFAQEQNEAKVRNRQARQERVEEFAQQEQRFTDEFERAASQRADAVRQHERQRLDTVRQYERQRTDTVRQYEESRTETIRSHEQQRAESIRQYEQEIAREAEDFARSRARAQEQFNRQVAELQEEAARREAEWRADLEQRLSELREDSSERVADLQADADRERARRESDHRERLLEAAARLDARAVAQEQRRFAKEEAERQQDLAQRLTDERENLQERIDEDTAASDQRLAEARDADARRLADMQADFAQRQRLEDEDRALRLQRDAEDHERQLNQEDAFHVERLNKLDTSHADQLARMESAHSEQLARMDDLYTEQSDKQEIAHRKQLQKLDADRLNITGIYDKMNADIVDSATRAKTAIETGQQMTPEMRASINWSSPTPPSWWLGPWTPIYAPPEQPQSPSVTGSSVVIGEGAVQISGVGDPVGVGREVEAALMNLLSNLR